IGLRKSSKFQVSSAQVETAGPIIRQILGFEERLESLARIVSGERDFTLDQLSVSLRIRLQFGSEIFGQRPGAGRVACLSKNTASKKTNVCALAVCKCAVGRRNRCFNVVLQESNVSKHRKFSRGPAGGLGVQIFSRALLQNADGIGKAALIQGQITQ